MWPDRIFMIFIFVVTIIQYNWENKVMLYVYYTWLYLIIVHICVWLHVAKFILNIHGFNSHASEYFLAAPWVHFMYF